ncbi:MAG TPA: tetratricopeptide repeat protein [Thermoanaerobaculia bacterium]
MSLERIEITPFAVIVGDIVQNRRTGSLSIIKAPVRKNLYWSQGELVLITSVAPEDSLGEFLVRRGVITADRAFAILADEPSEVVARFHESGLLDLSSRQTLLREWIASLFIPLFALDEGTAAFTEEEPLPPEQRIFVQSTAALVLEGIRAITNGLVLRRSLGDLKREIAPSRNSRFDVEAVPLNDAERRIATSLHEPQPIDVFLKHFATDSVTAAKVVIGMLTLGIFGIVEFREQAPPAASFDDMQRDLELLAAIGSNDQRSLRAVAFSRQIGSLDHYQVIDVPRAATRQQIITGSDLVKKKYDPNTYPPIVRDALQTINRRIDEAMNVLKDAGRRASYDKLLQQRGGRGADASIQQRLTQRSIAEQNYARAKELTIDGDYYGAIVLLKQAVAFAPDHAHAWYLLGSCQERNPKWRREAAESFQMALSIDPNFVEALISLGDLYKLEGMISRAQTCYEDVLKIAPDNQQAKSRLSGFKKR